MTTPHPWTRVNYAEGMVLGAADLAAEQAYLVAKDRQALALNLGWGVVWGLRVEATDPPGPAVVVRPGLAVDGMGCDLHVTEPCVVDVPPGRRPVWLLLVGDERPVDPAPIAGGDEPVPRRIEEGVRFELSAEYPSVGPDRLAPLNEALRRGADLSQLRQALCHAISAMDAPEPRPPFVPLARIDGRGDVVAPIDIDYCSDRPLAVSSATFLGILVNRSPRLRNGPPAVE